MKIITVFETDNDFRSEHFKSLGHQVKTMSCREFLSTNNTGVDFVWIGFPCRVFSMMAIGKHWYRDNKPKSIEAEVSYNLAKKVLKKALDFNCCFVFENPMGKLRKLGPFVITPRTTVTYCQYGDIRQKMTDLWNNFNFVGKRCKNGASCHQAAPRGSRQGTQGLEVRQRRLVPIALVREVLECVKAKV